MHNRNQKRHESPCEPRAPQVREMPKGLPSLKTAASPHKALRAPREPQHLHSPFRKALHAVYPPKASRGKACVSIPVVSLEKMPVLGRVEGGHIQLSSASSFSSSSSSLSSSLYSSPLPVSHKSQERLVNGKGPVVPPAQFEQRIEAPPSPYDRQPSFSPSVMDRQAKQQASPSPMDKRSCAPPTVPDRKNQNGTEGNKGYKRLSGRVFDPNKHCGVLDPESNRPCTRSLTCKTHSLTHRRAVLGRKKLFDALLAEHKGRAKEKDKGSKREARRGRGSQSPEPVPADFANGHEGKSPLKTRLATLCVPRLPGAAAGSTAGPFSCPVPPSAHDHLCTSVEGCSRLSSDETEGDGEALGAQEGPNCHCSPQHPRPHACCAFGARLMGHGCYVFSRRWDRLRVALRCMVEKHISSQMWKKIPVAVDNPASFSGSPGALPCPHRSSPVFLPSSATTPPLLTPPRFAPPADGTPLLSFPAAFSQGGGERGMFSILDSSHPSPSGLDPLLSPGKQTKIKPGRPPRQHGQTPSALGTGAVGGGRKRKATPTSAPSSTTFVMTPRPSLTAPASNGTTSIRAKSEPPRHVEAGCRGNSALVFHAHSESDTCSSHGNPPEPKKRKACVSYPKSSKVPKLPELAGIFRKSGAGLLPTVPEPPLPALHLQPKIHH